jgi:HlyD family secretion protein
MGKVISVPSAAVKRDGVWVLRDGRARFKPVTSGVATLDGRTQIVEGLNEGDEIIVHSQQPLRDGLRVEAVAEIIWGKP